MQTKSNQSGARILQSLLIVFLMFISNCTVLCNRNNARHHKHLHRRRLLDDDDMGSSFIVAQHVIHKPEIDTKVSSQMNVLLDDPAYLHCRIMNRGDFEVTWIRHRDRQLLTVGEDRFTDDHRFQISYRKDGDNVEDMTLLLRYTRKNDSGIYECQVSTDPPLRFLVTLNVLETKKLAKKSDLPSNDSPDRQSVNADFVSSENSSNFKVEISFFAILFCLFVNLVFKKL